MFDNWRLMAHATVGSSVEADKRNKKNASENIVCTSMDNSVPSAIAQPVPPDGGWGYVVVLASFLIHVIADGVTYSFGVFYLELLYYFEGGKGATAWIASILVGVTLCSGPISSTLVNKFGCRAVTMAGSILATASLLTSMWARNIITLYFSIGIGTGLGFGLIYLPAIVSVTCYFEKYRSLATGIAVCGSGLGTLIFAPFVDYLIALYGWRGAIMICSGIVLNCTVLGALFRPLPTRKLKKRNPTEKSSLKKNPHKYLNGLYNQEDNQKCVLQSVSFRKDSVACVKSLSQPVLISTSAMQQNSSEDIYKEHTSNLPQRYNQEALHERQSSTSLPNKIDYVRTENREVSTEREANALKKYVDFSILKDPVFILFTVSNFFTSIGFYVPYVYVLPQAEERGINKKDASYLLAVIGIANTVGRIILGYISDKPWINRLLIYNLSLTICGIATIFSAFCSSFVSFTVYTSIFGFTSGAYVGLTSVILVDLLGLNRLTNAFGQLLLFQGFASFLGPPIAGWLYDALKSYDPGFLTAGGMMTVSGLILFFIPVIQQKIQKREKTKGTINNT
ncbi:monocarboxylate transporter 12 isoform X2 [Ceratina calcarata]|uniref:Monocarboxylate transporter 12 isoform X2 n=1 Tax=Ceratina calcarata TaxID=156304 RepID=A0AAJ7J815_9HYME|nr:monocarboxylate transporter 12 isoform X2 [Ceratina calcarata]